MSDEEVLLREVLGDLWFDGCWDGGVCGLVKGSSDRWRGRWSCSSGQISVNVAVIASIGSVGIWCSDGVGTLGDGVDVYLSDPDSVERIRGEVRRRLG
jgi:hypothetical protein